MRGEVNNLNYVLLNCDKFNQMKLLGWFWEKAVTLGLKYKKNGKM